jgi:hypothetical protein
VFQRSGRRRLGECKVHWYALAITPSSANVALRAMNHVREQITDDPVIILTSKFGVRVPGGVLGDTNAHQQILEIKRILLVGVVDL